MVIFQLKFRKFRSARLYNNYSIASCIGAVTLSQKSSPPPVQFDRFDNVNIATGTQMH